MFEYSLVAFFITTSACFFVGAVGIWSFTTGWDPNRRVLQQYSCFWASLYLWANPFWAVDKITGLEYVRPGQVYVMVVNHQSMVDILVLFRTFLHFKWVSKASIFWTPFIGWNMMLNGYVPIHRGDPKSREKCMDKCRQWLRYGSSVLFFPEGTRSKDGQLQGFKPGAFRLAIETQLPVLPIVILGSKDALPKHSIFLSRKSRMSLCVLPPVPVPPVIDAELNQAAVSLAQAVQTRMKAVLENHLT